MKKKRIIISMLTLLCCCTGAWADEVDNDTHLKYTVADDEVTITGFADDFTLGANYALVIPDVIDGKPVVAVGASAFFEKTNFTTLTIGKNVKTIGTDAFRKASTMTSVTFAPDGVLETLGESAFRGCAELTEFVMPNTVTTIGQYALAVNAKLESVTLSNQLTTLAQNALCDCPMLKTVVIPASVTTIESRAFKNANGGLEEITIPSTVTSVASDAFYICNNLNTVTWNSATVPENIFKDKKSLQTVTFGEGVTTIKNFAFQGCTGLTELTIPATLTKIETFAFTGCTNVTTVTTQDGTLAKTGDYYELSTLAHWRLFSVLVQANNTANAKMTDDIDLGNDQTMIGFYNGYPSSEYPYQGTFDGQNHTLTIHYVTTKNHYTAPFQLIQNSTIKNLHVTGTINATHGSVGGLVGCSYSSGSIINCRSSIALTSSFTGGAGYGGFVAGGSPNIKDSYFDGSFNAPNACGCGGFVGGNRSETKIDNCLFNPQSFVVGKDETYGYSGPFTTWNGSNQSVTPTNSYFTFHVNTSQQGTRVYTSENVPEGAPTTEVTAADGNKYYVITRITGLTDDKDFEYGQAGYYFVNLKKTGTKTLTLTADDVQELEKASASTIKIYDDQGKNANSMCGNSTLELNAPEGYQLQLTGYVKTYSSYNDDNFKVYDGNSTSATLLYEKGSGSQKVNIGPFTSTGQSLTINFSGSGEGLNLTATLVPPLVELADNSDDLSALEAYAGRTCTVTYSRSFTEAKSSTVCLPFAFAKGSVGTFYTFTGITHEGSNYEATMTEYTGATLEANTPYLFTPSATGDVDFGGTYTLPASITAGSATSGDWTYLGTYETISWTEAPTGIYGFSAQAVGDIQQGEFVKVGAYVRIKPMRCYLKYKNGLANYAGARGMTRAADEELPETIKVRLIGADGEVTAIGSLQTKTGEVTFDKDAWYSLDGRRIEGKPTVKGIYVNNGKKVIIK